MWSLVNGAPCRSCRPCFYTQHLRYAFTCRSSLTCLKMIQVCGVTARAGVSRKYEHTAFYPWWNVTDIPALRFKWCKTVSILSSDEKKKYVVLIFENELTLPDQITLEEIFTEMGKCHNISCFPVKLSFEEASNRLKSHNCAQKQEVGQDMQLKYVCLHLLTLMTFQSYIFIYLNFLFFFLFIWFCMSSH